MLLEPMPDVYCTNTNIRLETTSDIIRVFLPVEFEAILIHTTTLISSASSAYEVERETMCMTMTMRRDAYGLSSFPQPYTIYNLQA